MKKMLVAALVLGFATIASATIEPAEVELGVNGVVTDKTTLTEFALNLFGYKSLDGVTEYFAGPYYVEIVGNGTLENPVEESGSSFDGIKKMDNGYQFSVTAYPDPIGAGRWFTVDATGEVGTQFVVYGSLENGNVDYSNVLHAVTIVPEPMSVALLGLGGLFLRRRK